MNILSEMLSSRTRAEIFRLLFGVAEDELHVREIQRRCGLNDSTIRQELGKLARLNLVKGRKDGNRLYYSANKENPLYSDLRSLVIKTVGLSDIIRNALQDDRILLAFIFGSIAEGRETAESDVDLFIIGDIGLRKLSGMLSDVSGKIGREINPHVMTKKEFRKRIHTNEHFVSSVVSAPKFFILGSERDLRTMGR